MADINQINQMRQQFFKQKQDEVSRQMTGAQQEQDDALKRRFAALGQQGSGAQIGAQLKGQEQIQGQRNSAMNELAGQEAQANIASQEAELGRQFQAQEAQKSRDLQNAQFGKEFGLKGDIFNFEKGNKLRELDMAQRQMLNDEATTAYNQAMTTLQSPYSAQRLQDDVGEILRNLERVRAGRLAGARPMPAPPAQTSRTMGGDTMGSRGNMDVYTF